jgi:hypothetical protein
VCAPPAPPMDPPMITDRDRPDAWDHERKMLCFEILNLTTNFISYLFQSRKINAYSLSIMAITCWGPTGRSHLHLAIFTLRCCHGNGQFA